MTRGTFSLRFLLFWVIPYVALAAIILGFGYGDDSPQSKAHYFSWGARITLVAALTCSWLTLAGVTWAVRHYHETDFQ